MPIINNFSKLLPKLVPIDKSENLFYHVQIIKRAKDNPGESSKVIRSYFFKSLNDISIAEGELMTWAMTYGARVYINPSPKSFKKLLGMVAKQSVDNVIANNIVNPEHIVSSCAGKLKPSSQRWIIDVDDISYKYDVHKWLIMNGLTVDDILEVETVHGCHFITPKFDSKKFNDMFPHIDIHKNSMGTLLFFAYKER